MIKFFTKFFRRVDNIDKIRKIVNINKLDELREEEVYSIIKDGQLLKKRWSYIFVDPRNIIRREELIKKISSEIYQQFKDSKIDIVLGKDRSPLSRMLSNQLNAEAAFAEVDDVGNIKQRFRMGYFAPHMENKNVVIVKFSDKGLENLIQLVKKRKGNIKGIGLLISLRPDEIYRYCRDLNLNIKILGEVRNKKRGKFGSFVFRRLMEA